MHNGLVWAGVSKMFHMIGPSPWHKQCKVWSVSQAPVLVHPYLILVQQRLQSILANCGAMNFKLLRLLATFFCCVHISFTSPRRLFLMHILEGTHLASCTLLYELSNILGFHQTLERVVGNQES